MNDHVVLLKKIDSGMLDVIFSQLYQCGRPEQTDDCRARYLRLIESFAKNFGGQGNISLYSAPGRVEMGGNHTDHQGGRVLAAAVTCDAIAAARPNGDGVIRMRSEGFEPDIVSLGSLEPVAAEYCRSTALIRGVAAGFIELGHAVAGFDAYISSEVSPGSGLSSSAAFEVLIGNVINSLFCGGSVGAEAIARIGQRAENIYFGKPCGLMDQMASSVGGAMAIDFANPDSPYVQTVDFNFASCGHALCIIDSGGDHAGLTEHYAAIPEEMRAVAQYFGHERLRQVNPGDFYRAIPQLRKAAGDRAVLRAMHFFDDDARVARQAAKLKAGDFTGFLGMVRESGISSGVKLQNIVTPGGGRQELALALAECERLLAGRGACRVHGGGFAGTVQAYVPDNMLDEFTNRMEAALGVGCCRVMGVRPRGGMKLEV